MSTPNKRWIIGFDLKLNDGWVRLPRFANVLGFRWQGGPVIRLAVECDVEPEATVVRRFACVGEGTPFVSTGIAIDGTYLGHVPYGPGYHIFDLDGPLCAAEILKEPHAR